MDTDNNHRQSSDEPDARIEPIAMPQPHHAGEAEQKSDGETPHAEPTTPPAPTPQRGIAAVGQYLNRWRTWDRDDVEVFFSSVVAFASLVGVGGLIVGSCLTLASLEETRKANRAAERAASAAERTIAQGEGLARMQMDQAERLNREGLTAEESIAGAGIDAQRQIASDQLAVQRDTYRLEQRAWLSLNVRINQAGQIRLPVANSGATPAFDVIGTVLYSVSRPENLQQLTEGLWARMPQSSLGTIPRQETGRELMPLGNMTPDEMARYKAGQHLYVFARLRYCDAFGYQHRLEICAYSLATSPDIAYCGRSEDPPTSRVPCGPNK